MKKALMGLAVLGLLSGDMFAGTARQDKERPHGLSQKKLGSENVREAATERAMKLGESEHTLEVRIKMTIEIVMVIEQKTEAAAQKPAKAQNTVSSKAKGKSGAGKVADKGNSCGKKLKEADTKADAQKDKCKSLEDGADAAEFNKFLWECYAVVTEMDQEQLPELEELAIALFDLALECADDGDVFDAIWAEGEAVFDAYVDLLFEGLIPLAELYIEVCWPTWNEASRKQAVEWYVSLYEKADACGNA